MERYDYDLCFLDGLKAFEIEMFLREKSEETRVIIVDTNHDLPDRDRCTFLPKDFPLEDIRSSLRAFISR